ncbi:MAG: hypothetical protein HQL76_00975 [Magnetococcales bacterium]|nr:hypothetical protein [Magnetococcales bacterium]
MKFKHRPLPALREDLAIVPGPIDSLDGTPTWIIHDPVRHRFFRIGPRQLHMMNHWKGGITLEALWNAIEDKRTGSRFSRREIYDLFIFLRDHQLLSLQGLESNPARRTPWWRSFLGHYLFFRIPLIDPDPFLGRILPGVDFLFSRWFLVVQGVMLLWGWFMTMHHWDRFIDTIPRVYGPEGAMLLAVALLLAKGVHELGHALAAKRLGIHVPSMGVAFMVMWPVFYTELSEAWKISSRRQRLKIAAAGMKAELSLAIWATALWNLSPDGPVREALFLLAGSTWIMTLAINSNPFMRFDGYFLLSDVMDIPNLHDRAFAMGCWWLRRLVLGVSMPPPEPWPVGRRRFLIAFAWATWCYRLLLFVSIALLVYHLFFKLLGLVLLVVELGWFVLRPVARELGVWGDLMADPGGGRVAGRLLGWLMAVVVVLLVPWPASVEIGAVIRPEILRPVYAPQEGIIENLGVSLGRVVQRGEEMLRLGVPALDLELLSSRKRMEVLQRRLEWSLVAVGNLELRANLLQQKGREEVVWSGLKRKKDRLSVIAPETGRVVWLADPLHVGEWVGTVLPLLTLAGNEWQILGYAKEENLREVALGKEGRFYFPANAFPSLALRLVSIGKAESTTLDLPELASIHGGPVDARLDAKGRPEAMNPVYRVVFSIKDKSWPGIDRTWRGVVVLPARGRSILETLFEWGGGSWVHERQF